MQRTFIALELPVSQNLKNILEAFRKEVTGLSVKWVEPHQMHITLAFLGDTTPSQIKAIKEELQAISCKYKPLHIRFNKLGLFKSGIHPKVIWIGLMENSALLQLAIEIRQFLHALGFEFTEHDFLPHLTLGRVKNSTPGNNLQNLVQKYNQLVNEEIWAESFVFYESILTPSGPIYRPIQVYQIKA